MLVGKENFSPHYIGRNLEAENVLKKRVSPGQCGLVSWSVVPYTKRLGV